MITAVERGRKLIITVGDEDDSIVITVPPVSTAVGSTLLGLWARVVIPYSSEDESKEDLAERLNADATAMARLAVGEENWPVVESLRSAESNLVINAAAFWNVQGGGIELVNEMFRDGLPKARQTLAETNGFGEVLSQLQTYLNGVSASRTRLLAGTPDTSTPVGTSGSFGKLHSQP